MAESDYAPTRPYPLARVPRWDIETDIAIVGFGGAGACAAIEAAGAGAKVTLFERASGNGGTSALSGGEMYIGGNGGSPVQRKAGFEDTTEDFFRYLMMAGGPDADEAKVRLYAESSLAHHQWMKEQGVPYRDTYISSKIIEPETDDCLIWCGSEEAWPFSAEAKPCPRGHTPQWMGWGGGRLVMDVLAARVEKLGVDIRYDSGALALVVDEAGAVKGLVVRIDSQPRCVRAQKGVILCAGGFVMNRDMVRRHAPLFLRSVDPIGTPGDDGSGIEMGMSVGAAAIHMDQCFCTVPWYPPESLVKGIFVNEQGQRFINEDCYHGRVSAHIIEQKGDRIFLLADSATFARPDAHELARIDIGAAGETWQEVEAELSLPEGSLTATVELYNKFAARGEDPLFHKAKKWLKPLDEPPFAALDCKIGQAFYSHFTLGGLDTLPTGEVLTEDRQVIPGLYAAGRTACGLPRWGKGYSSGMSVADATFFGRQAGRRAATVA